MIAANINESKNKTQISSRYGNYGSRIMDEQNY